MWCPNFFSFPCEFFAHVKFSVKKRCDKVTAQLHVCTVKIVFDTNFFKAENKLFLMVPDAPTEFFVT